MQCRYLISDHYTYLCTVQYSCIKCEIYRVSQFFAKYKKMSDFWLVYYDDKNIRKILVTR